MIKFLFTHPLTKRRIMGIGLSRLNCERLLSGKPIHYNAEQFNLSVLPPINEVLILAGETEQTIYDELKEKGYVTEETIITPMLGSVM